MGRFRPVYGPLKNIENMAKEMQLLLPASKRTEAIQLLKKMIDIYLKKPNADKVIEFANSIILMTPFF